MGKPSLVPRQKCETIRYATATDVVVSKHDKAPSLREGAYSAHSSPSLTLWMWLLRKRIATLASSLVMLEARMGGGISKIRAAKRG